MLCLQDCAVDACVCISHPCLDDAGDVSNVVCNPLGGNSHTCVEVYNADTQQCEFTCTCASGYEFNSDTNLCVGQYSYSLK